MQASARGRTDLCLVWSADVFGVFAQWLLPAEHALLPMAAHQPSLPPLAKIPVLVLCMYVCVIVYMCVFVRMCVCIDG